jgi:hypothetical protein
MLKRLIVGLVLGTVIGAVIAAVLVQGLGWLTFGNAAFAYLAAAATGALAGLVAGKPIWSADGRIEAGLKAFFGVLLSLGGMFALRQWAKVDVDLGVLKAGHGYIGELPAASLPIIAAVLSAFYELDNTPSDKKDEEEESKASGERTAASKKKVRVAKDEEQSSDEEPESEPASEQKKKKS